MKVTRKSAILEHPQIAAVHAMNELEVLEMIVDSPFNASLRYAFETAANLYLISDFIPGGDLFTRQQKVKIFREADACFYLAEVILAIEQLHEKNIIYRDVKTENILLDSEGHVVLTDFGAAKFLRGRTRTQSYCGTEISMVSLLEVELKDSLVTF